MGQLGAAIDAKKQGRRDDIDLSYWTVQPNRWTFQSDKIREWVESWCQGKVLNACCGKTVLELEDVVRNDINPDIDADYHIDVCEVGDHFRSGYFDTIVYDPPFSQNQANRQYDGRMVGDDALAKRQFHDILAPGGRVIQLGYTTTCMPLSINGDGQDYRRKAVAVFNTLGRMNDYLGTVDERLNGDVRTFTNVSDLGGDSDG